MTDIFSFYVKKVLVMKWDKLEKILSKWLSDFKVDVHLIKDVDIEFSSYYVVVYTKSAFPLRCISDIEKSINKEYGLYCDAYYFDFQRGFFSFEMV